jgi:hypothetical protein
MLTGGHIATVTRGLFASQSERLQESHPILVRACRARIAKDDLPTGCGAQGNGVTVRWGRKEARGKAPTRGIRTAYKGGQPG